MFARAVFFFFQDDDNCFFFSPSAKMTKGDRLLSLQTAHSVGERHLLAHMRPRLSHIVSKLRKLRSCIHVDKTLDEIDAIVGDVRNIEETVCELFRNAREEALCELFQTARINAG